MREVVLATAAAWLIGLFVVAVVYAVRTRSLAIRVLALDTLTVLMAGILVLLSQIEETTYLLDVALAVALLSPLTTLVAVRRFRRGRALS